MKKYKNLNCKLQKKLYGCLKKYGFQNFKVEIIENNIVEGKELDDKEKYYIKLFNTFKTKDRT
jgi:hypothetical protein